LSRHAPYAIMKKDKRKNVNRKFTIEDLNTAYRAGLKNIKGHEFDERTGEYKSAPGTIKMIGDIKIDLAKYCQQMKDLIKNVDDGFRNNSEEHKEIISMFQEAINQKANKWTEKVLIGVGSTIGIGFLSILGWLIVEAIKRFQ
jgi:hypothetical protein